MEETTVQSAPPKSPRSNRHFVLWLAFAIIFVLIVAIAYLLGKSGDLETASSADTEQTTPSPEVPITTTAPETNPTSAVNITPTASPTVSPTSTPVPDPTSTLTPTPTKKIELVPLNPIIKETIKIVPTNTPTPSIPKFDPPEYEFPDFWPF